MVTCGTAAGGSLEAAPSPPAQGRGLQGVPRCAGGDVCSEMLGWHGLWAGRSTGRHLQNEGFHMRSRRAVGMEQGAPCWNGPKPMGCSTAPPSPVWWSSPLAAFCRHVELWGTRSYSSPDSALRKLPWAVGGELAFGDGRWKDMSEQPALGPSIPVSCIQTAEPSVVPLHAAWGAHGCKACASEEGQLGFPSSEFLPLTLKVSLNQRQSQEFLLAVQPEATVPSFLPVGAGEQRLVYGLRS